MDQATTFDDDDIVMIEDDDGDEIVLLEQAPITYSNPFFNDTSIKNRASSVPRENHHQESTLRSQSDGSADLSHPTNLPLIDLTTDLATGVPTTQHFDQLEDKVYSVTSSNLGVISRDEEYESSLHWNITPETKSTQETPSNTTANSRRTNNRNFSTTSLNEMATKPWNTSHSAPREHLISNANSGSILYVEDEEEMALAQETPSRVDDDIILIEDNDDFEFKLEFQLLEKPEFEFLRSVSVSGKPKSQPSAKAFRTLRNPPITSPLFEYSRYLHEKLDLRPMKTVELDEGDFIYIKHIVDVEGGERFRVSQETGQDSSVKIRGLRLQRCKYLNGMLEKKMNELCLCYEIDLDDKREPEEQSLVEVPLSSVKSLRNLRWTNHHYPRYRNLNRDIARDNEDAYSTGGLTVRWKYTCTYASASAREQNLYAERTLERITENWLSSVHRTSHAYLTSNTRLRTEWRGETIAGGSYVPECYEIEEDDDSMPEVQQSENSLIVEDLQSRPKSFIFIDDDSGYTTPLPESQHGVDGIRIKRKSDFSSSSDLDCGQEDSQPAKRSRQDSENDIEKIRQRLGRVMLSFDGVDYVKHSYNIGTSSETNSGSSTERNTASTGHVRDPGGSSRSDPLNKIMPSKSRGRSNSQRSRPPNTQVSYPDNGLTRVFSSTSSPNIPPQIDITSSELASPLPSGVIDLSPSPHHSRSSSIATSNGSRSPSLKESRTLAPGQTFTYGDAFCGAGGTTRGAAMAGLRVKWGFDSDHHACTTWRLNFPHATCYEMSSERFVALATPSPYSSYTPDDVKVDILHLSPPCQYFSPAHTVEGKNDEKNTASLFAVAAVIKVAKPRVVTLEQTFGILYLRFRGYFHSLICMFTSCGFSLRWAIVPLAQWGLPQRRFRLIIIASCPGEPLPPMPPPTHSSTTSPLPNTHPFKTVYQTLREIPTTAANHPIHLMPVKDLKPYNPHAILPRTMTTSGGENWHPSGKRGLTDREFACLQGFPLQHRFGPTGIKKQIGNAVPPVVAKVLFGGIRRFMEEGDGIVRADEDGDGDHGIGDAMDVCEDMEKVEIVGDDEVEVIDLDGESDQSVGEEELIDEDDDEVEIIRVVDLGRHLVID